MTRNQSRPFARTTDQLEEILDAAVAEQAPDDFEAVTESVRDAGKLPVPAGGLYLTNYIETDHSMVLVFNNGHVEFLEQAEPLDGQPFDGDMWDVTPLGWS